MKRGLIGIISGLAMLYCLSTSAKSQGITSITAEAVKSNNANWYISTRNDTSKGKWIDVEMQYVDELPHGYSPNDRFVISRTVQDRHNGLTSKAVIYPSSGRWSINELVTQTDENVNFGETQTYSADPFLRDKNESSFPGIRKTLKEVGVDNGNASDDERYIRLADSIKVTAQVMTANGFFNDRKDIYVDLFYKDNKTKGRSLLTKVQYKDSTCSFDILYERDVMSGSLMSIDVDGKWGKEEGSIAVHDINFIDKIIYGKIISLCSNLDTAILDDMNSRSPNNVRKYVTDFKSFYGPIIDVIIKGKNKVSDMVDTLK